VGHSVCGEQGTDWEIRPSGTHGLGMFALRPFASGERILVEKPMAYVGTDGSLKFSYHTHHAMDMMNSLHHGDECSSPQTIFFLNSMEAGRRSGDPKNVLCLLMSRINHACNSNATHDYLSCNRVKVLVATKGIRVGEEITISYSMILCPSVDRFSPLFKHRVHLSKYGIVCPEGCACTGSPRLDCVILIREYRERIIASASSDTRRSVRMALQALDLFSEDDKDAGLHTGTLFDLAQMQAVLGLRKDVDKTMAAYSAASRRVYGESMPLSDRCDLSVLSRAYASGELMRHC
jgi:hypothetical protein